MIPRYKRGAFGFLALWAVLVSGLCLGLAHFDQDPLRALEARARSIDPRGARYDAPKTSLHYGDVLELERTLQLFGVGVTFGETPDNIAGFTTDEREITIDETLTWDGRLEVLAHETGHTMHAIISLPTKNEREVFAEAVGFLICRSYGRDTLDSSARYLSAYKGALHTIDDFREQILYAVRVYGKP